MSEERNEPMFRNAVLWILVLVPSTAFAADSNQIAAELRDCLRPHVASPPAQGADGPRPAVDCMLPAFKACLEFDSAGFGSCIWRLTAVYREQSDVIEASISPEMDRWARPIFSDLLRMRKICNGVRDEVTMMFCESRLELEHLDALLSTRR
jgi:hypothetical protein